MIIFKNVKWKNFLSTGNTFIEIYLDKNPTTLIIGENGAGKSTILDAMCFVLFGKPFRVINKAQLVNSVNNRETIVEIEFKVRTRDYKVIRGIRPNKFEIYCNGEMVNQDANSRDYQKYLEQNILKLNYRSFTQVVILGNSTFIPFMQLRAKHRREVVEEILDIKIFSLMNMILKNKIKDLTDSLRDINYQYELTFEKIGLQENYIDDLKKNKNKIIKDKTTLLAGNQEEIFNKTKQKGEIKTENESLLNDIDDKVKTEDKLQKLNNIRSTLVEKHKQHSGMIGFFKDNSDCPTCEQHIDEMFKKKMIVAKTGDVCKIVKGIKELKIELDKTDNRIKEIKSITEKIRKNDVKIAQSNSSILELEKFNTQLETEIANTNTIKKKQHNEATTLIQFQKKNYRIF